MGSIPIGYSDIFFVRRRASYHVDQFTFYIFIVNIARILGIKPCKWNSICTIFSHVKTAIRQ